MTARARGKINRGPARNAGKTSMLGLRGGRVDRINADCFFGFLQYRLDK